MKKINKKSRIITVLSLIVLLVLLCATSCASRCKVTFVLDDSGKSIAVAVDKGTTLWIPKSEDTRLSFAGWYLDRELTERYTEGSIERDVVLYAAWVEGNGESINITVHDGSCEPETITVASGSRVGELKKPTKDGYIFKGWSDRAAGEVVYNEEDFLVKSCKLYPVFEPDPVALVNNASVKALSATVAVTTTRYSSNIMRPSNVSGGSGVIIEDEGTGYLVVTNHHVVEQRSGYNTRKFTVTDCYGNEYDANLLYSMAEYDLALLRFSKGQEELTELPIGADPEVGALIAAIGCPKGALNTVTVGRVAAYNTVEVNGNSAVNFKVGIHLAPTDHGSSGGAVINADMELVGINFAYSVDEENSYTYGVFIQSSKLCEFLKLVGYN